MLEQAGAEVPGVVAGTGHHPELGVARDEERLPAHPHRERGHEPLVARLAKRGAMWRERSLDPFDALVQPADGLKATRLVTGVSPQMSSDELARRIGLAWERLPEPRPRLTLEVYSQDGSVREYTLGPHTPRLRPRDLELLHEVWLKVTSDPQYAGAHHYHIVALALEELQKELNTEQRTELLRKLSEEIHGGRDVKN